MSKSSHMYFTLLKRNLELNSSSTWFIFKSRLKTWRNSFKAIFYSVLLLLWRSYFMKSISYCLLETPWVSTILWSVTSNNLLILMASWINSSYECLWLWSSSMNCCTISLSEETRTSSVRSYLTCISLISLSTFWEKTNAWLGSKIWSISITSKSDRLIL